MFDINDKAAQDPRIAEARKNFEAAMAAADKYALELNVHGIEAVVSGWTGPMERGEIRMQGNAGIRYHEHGTMLEAYS